MKIVRVTTFVIKASRRRYEVGSGARDRAQLPRSDYLRYDPFPQLYSQNSEALVVRIVTDAGISGWGEGQAPIAPEVVEQVVHRILGPIVLGQSALEVNVRFMEMFEAMRIRGQGAGMYVDALAAMDTALWDIRARASGMSLGDALGGQFRQRLPCYASGLRAETPEGRLDEAKAHIDAGISGVKLFLGHGLRQDEAAIDATRRAMGPDGKLLVDAMWRYDLSAATTLGRICEANRVGFLESPILPEDIDGHVVLARQLDVAVALGETLRTRFQFMPWLQRGALDVCQPDLMRNSVSETYKIALLAESFNKPVALHTGCTTAVGLAATYQVASALPNFLIQEYQPVMLEVFNDWLKSPIVLSEGEILIPDGPGLGIEIDEEKMSCDVATAHALEL